MALIKEHGDQIEVVEIDGKYYKRYYKTEEDAAFWKQAVEKGLVRPEVLEHVLKPFHIEISFSEIFQGFQKGG